MRFVSSTVVVALLACGVAVANVPANGSLVIAASAKSGGVPPGLAKKGGVPPGLAKQFGATVPEKAYVAIDPRYDDRAWFLIDGSWVLRQGFDPNVRVEGRDEQAREGGDGRSVAGSPERARRLEGVLGAVEQG